MGNLSTNYTEMGKGYCVHPLPGFPKGLRLQLPEIQGVSNVRCDEIIWRPGLKLKRLSDVFCLRKTPSKQKSFWDICMYTDTNLIARNVGCYVVLRVIWVSVNSLVSGKKWMTQIDPKGDGWWLGWFEATTDMLHDRKRVRGCSSNILHFLLKAITL